MKTYEKYLNERNPSSSFKPLQPKKVKAVIVWSSNSNIEQIKKLLSPIIKKVE